MTLIPEKVQEGVPDYELRDDPEWQLRALQKEVEKRVKESLDQGVEPALKDIEFLSD